MPYFTLDLYFENDFSDLDNLQLSDVASRFPYYVNDEKNNSIFEGLSPSPIEALKDFDEFRKLLSKIRYAAYSRMPVRLTKEEAARCRELRKTICETLFQWGEQLAGKLDKKDIFAWSKTGFPYIYMHSVRRPSSTSYLQCELDTKTRKVSLSSRNSDKLLNYFNWEISENGGVTWKLYRKTKYPKCEVTRLEPGQTYHFRYCISNLKGSSSYSETREVKIPGIAGKPSISIKKYPADGPVGALLDEYRRAISELKEVIRPISTQQLIYADYNIQDKNCRSIQTLLAHVVSAGHNYIVEIRRKMGEDLPYYDHHSDLLETPDQCRLALNGMFNYAVQLFEDHPHLALEELNPAKKILTRWGRLYDVEQLMEHAIVHVLRHRRQVERYLGRRVF